MTREKNTNTLLPKAFKIVKMRFSQINYKKNKLHYLKKLYNTWVMCNSCYNIQSGDPEQAVMRGSRSWTRGFLGFWQAKGHSRQEGMQSLGLCRYGNVQGMFNVTEWIKLRAWIGILAPWFLLNEVCWPLRSQVLWSFGGQQCIL